MTVSTLGVGTVFLLVKCLFLTYGFQNDPRQIIQNNTTSSFKRGEQDNLIRMKFTTQLLSSIFIME
ncbi:hypothetical protein ACVWYG_002792 [Pedobacter sp. UYEF25]